MHTYSAHLVDTINSLRGRLGICFGYFYCTFDNATSHQPVNILGSIVAQLSHSMPSILDNIRPIFEKAKGNKLQQPIELSILEAAIIKESTASNDALILIDAINESTHTSAIISCLHRLMERSEKLRILVTTTTDAGSLRAQDPSRVIILEMHPEIVRQDIEAFVEYRLQSDESLRYISEELKSDIRETLLINADGS